MAPYYMSLGEQADMSQDTSANDLLSDDDDDDLFDELPSLPIIPVPDIFPTENSLPQLLALSCGTEDFQEITSVQLKIIASQVNLQRLHIYLPHLIELDLTGSHLLSLRPLGYGLDSLCILRVGRCSLSSLDGVFGVSGLRELYAPHNSVSELGLLATLPLLRVLDLRRNLVSSLQQVGFLSMCGDLRELTLAECPVSELPGYKASVITTLPGLNMLDEWLLAEGGRDLCHEEKQESFDRSDEEDGAMALSVEHLNIQESIDYKKENIELSEPVKRRRPATAFGPRPQASYVLPDRPATAVSKRPFLHPTTEPEVVTDTVSKLTSGGVVCGNLAAALRGKHRQRKPAWSTQDTEKEKILFKNGLTVEKLYTEVEHMQPEKNGGSDNHRQPLLEASRQWREAYHSFRKVHREQWKKEEEEEGA